MLNVRVWNYGNYSSNNYGSCRAVTIGDLILYYSYNTVVAFRDGNKPLVISQNIWSNTTGRHLNWINPDKTVRIPNDEFEDTLSRTLRQYKLEKVGLCEQYNIAVGA